MLVRPEGRGFTLIELLVVMVIMSIMVAYAVPNYQEWIARSRMRSAAEGLQNALRLAQATAIQRNRRVVFSLTNDPLSITAQPAANGLSWFSQTLPLVAAEAATLGRFLGGDTLARDTGVSVTGPATICFNSVGRLVAMTVTTPDGVNVVCSLPAVNNLFFYDLQVGTNMPIRVEVFLGGQIRMSNVGYLISATHPDGRTPP